MDWSITNRARCRFVEHCGFLCQGSLVRRLAGRIARVAARVLARTVCDPNFGAADSQAVMGLADVADDGLLCCHGVVLHVSGRSWSSCQRNLVAVSVSRLGHARQCADFRRTRQRTGPTNVLLLYRGRRPNSRMRDAQRERALRDGTGHLVRDVVCGSRLADAQHQEWRPGLVDCIKSFGDCVAPSTMGLE